MTVPPRESRVVDTTDGFPDILPENIGIQLQLQCLKGQCGSVPWVQAYLRIEGEGAFPDGGHHIVIGVDRDTELLSEGKNPGKILRILFGHRAADFHIHVSCAEQPDCAKGLIEALRKMAQTVVGSGIGTIERDVDAARRVCGKKIGPGFVQQSSVCIDGKNHAQISKPAIQRFKIRKEQRFPAGQKKKNGTGLLHLFCKANPFLHRAKPSLPFHFRTGQTDIAHVAVHIAKRQKLKRAGNGNVLLAGFLEKGMLKGRSVVHIVHKIPPKNKNRSRGPEIDGNRKKRIETVGSILLQSFEKI